MSSESESARRAREEWERNELHRFVKRQPEAKERYETLSGLPVKRVYTPEDAVPFGEIGLPGQYPFTRGPYPTMYRGRNWTMRQIAGYGTGEDTNRRFRYLIEQGQTGLSVDFDMPTLMGYDSDDPRSLGEVGREGVALSTLDDVEALFDGIDLTQISVSMTINPTAWILLAMYVALAQSRGYDLNALSGTVQADILKEYMAEKEWIFPIRSSLRVVRDLIVYCAKNLARYNPINISGYHISEAGANAVQELAFTMCNAVTYFEEVAQFRAARRIWAKVMRERFGARKPESMRLRFHCQTAAATLTKAQPLNNIVRTALQALSAVLGGAQSLHTNGLDEAYAIPSETAMKVALRTQQIIADETRVTQVVDPLGGSWYLESLTSEMERQAFAVLDRVQRMGGTVKAIEEGFFQREIAETAYLTTRKRASGEQPWVGMNRYVDPPKKEELDIHKINPATEQRQIARTKEVRRRRNEAKVAALLDRLDTEARDPAINLMPVTIELVKARATLGEIVARLKKTFGTYVETPVF